MSKTPKHVNERKDLWKGELQVRPEGNQPLTDQQEAWVAAYVDNGGDALKAADASGLSREDGKALLKDARARAAVELRRDTEIKTRIASKALSKMEEILDDPAAPAHVKATVAKWFLEASGHGLSAVAASLQLGLKKQSEADLHKLSVSELEEIALRGRKAWEAMRGAASKVLTEGHQTIDVTPKKLSEGQGS